MDSTYTLAGVALEAGSWADWFSGGMSFAAVVTALLGYWFVRKQRIDDQKDRERRAAESVGWKALRVFNDTANIAKHLKASLEGSPKTEYQVMRFMRVRPLGIPAKAAPDLTPDEVNILLKAKAADMLMALSDCLTRYESIRVAMQEYKSRHESLFELMPPPTKGEGTFFTHILNQSEFDKIMPYANMLEKLLDGIIDLVMENVKESQSVLDQYGPSMRLYFGKWHLSFTGDRDDADLTKVADRAEPGPK